MNEEITEGFKWLENPMIQRLGVLFLAIVLILIVFYFVKTGLNKTLKTSENKYKGRKLANFVSYIFIVIAALFVFSDKLGNIGVTLGLAGAGIAFALQEVIISFAGWIKIILTNHVSVGQRVKIGEVKGDIIDIGILSTTIMEIGDWVNGDLYNGSIANISNSFVFKDHVHNYSAEYPFLWDEITVPLRTESDFKLAKKVFSEVLEEVCGDYAKQSQARWMNLANKYKVEEAQVRPMVHLVFDENWITFTLRYIVDYKSRRSTKDRIFTRLLEEIQKYDDIIMIATSSIEITNVTPED
ncbi:MAG: mechanosensitive ion channel family protein [Flavobacteriales bacterium]|nr:mechanosensitive ion channel family protein [Flavobacteriales bacterium]